MILKGSMIPKQRKFTKSKRMMAFLIFIFVWKMGLIDQLTLIQITKSFLAREGDDPEPTI